MSEFGSARDHGRGMAVLVAWTAAIVLLGTLTALFFAWIKPTFIDADRKADNAQTQTYNESRGRQNVLVDQITKNIQLVGTITGQIDAATKADPKDDQIPQLKAQRKNAANMVCDAGAKVLPGNLSADQAAFVNDNCYAGSVKPGSQYDV